MKSKTHIGLSMLMLLSAPVIAAENSEQGAVKPPAELRQQMSGATLTATTNTAVQPSITIVVDKVDTYIPHPDEVAAQQQAR